MVKIYVNNILFFVPYNSTVLEACKVIGIEVPRFCFHEKLNVAGNCRMCLVEIEKSPKPVVSCAMPVIPNMKIFTNTPLVKKARENILEFLLVNHPLDCPICDQGGECDLQDQTMVFGMDKNRNFAFKRSVEDKNCGSLVKTIMNRCIHCTRCVRFIIDILGVTDFGTTKRGKTTEIGTYLEKGLESELSANIIDLCPVGALTSKPYAFLARPWELRTLHSIDLMDAVGSNIRIDLKETEIIRILPKINEHINEEWITDKARYCFDGLKSQRIDQPFFRDSTGYLKTCSWEKAIKELSEIISKTSPSEISLLVSPNLGLSSFMEIKQFAILCGFQNMGFPRSFCSNTDFVDHFTFNTSMDDIRYSDFCLFVGCNPRYEASLLNLKIRKNSKNFSLNTYSIGLGHDLTYKNCIIGISPQTLLKIGEGKHPLCKRLKAANRPVVIYSASLLERKDFRGLLSILVTFCYHTLILNIAANGFCELHQESNQVGALFIGLKSINTLRLKKQKVCFLIGDFKENDLYFIKNYQKSKLKLISLCSNGSLFTKDSSVILPLVNAFESEDFFVNIEGVFQKASKILSISPLNKELSEIFFLILNGLKKSTALTSMPQLEVFSLSKKEKKISFFCLRKKSYCCLSVLSKTAFFPFLTDFYSSGFLSESSQIMANCSHFYRKKFTNFLHFF